MCTHQASVSTGKYRRTQSLSGWTLPVVVALSKRAAPPGQDAPRNFSRKFCVPQAKLALFTKMFAKLFLAFFHSEVAPKMAILLSECQAP